ncbi:MAG: protein kinase domain-containing protein, partial [Gammaproteobacteria bacterium]
DGLSARQIELAGQRISREARTAAKLHHPRIVSIFDVVMADGAPWLVLEYLPSRSLAEIVGETGPLAPTEVARIGAQIADALHAAHQAGITHRDVKPGNVLVTEQKLAKLADFGISRAVDDTTLTGGPGVPSGTPGYFAPEVARGEAGGPAADVYALGATLYAAVEGAAPFAHLRHDLATLLAHIERGRIPPPRKAGPLTAVLTGLLATDPDDRPSPADARRMLEEVAAERPVTAPRGWSAQRKRMALGIGGLLAGCALGVGLLLARHLGDSTADPRAAGPAWPPAPVGPVTLPDPHAKDPCSLLDPKALTRFGQASLQQDVGRFGQCGVQIALPGNAEVAVEVEFDTPLAADQTVPGAVERLGGLTIGREPAAKGSCERTIMLTDRTRIGIKAANYGEQPASVDFCAIAEAATRTAVSVLAGDGLRDRPPPAAGSLIGVDACALLDASALARVEGLDPADRTANFGNWRCEWDDSDVPGQPAVTVLFYRSNPVGLRPGAQPTVIGGRGGQIVPGGLDRIPQACLVQTGHRGFTGRTGEKRIELLLVSTFGPQPTEALCQAAVDLTATAVAKLPPPG